MESRLPEIPIVANLVATIVRQFRLSEGADLVEFFNIVKENIEKMLKSDKECIMRIIFFLDKVYEIRLLKYKEYIYLSTNFRKTNNKEPFEIMIELYNISKYAMNYYIYEFKETERFNVNSVDEIVIFIRNLLIKNLINIKIDKSRGASKPPSFPTAKAYHLQETGLSPQNRQVMKQKSINIDKKILNNIIKKVIYSSYSERKIVDIINRYGVVALGSGSKYTIIYKYDDENCKYVVIMYRNGDYEAYCVRELNNIIDNIKEEMIVA